MKDRRGACFNVLTGLVLVATVCLLAFYGAIALNVFNPFPFPEVGAGNSPPASPTPVPATATPTVVSIPTWTPTSTPTITPTPGPTNTRTATPTATATFTFPPTITPTPRVTRSPDWAFTCEVNYRRPEYDSWTGVAGHVQDLDGNPLPGYHVQVECPGVGALPAVRAGVDDRINRIYGNLAAWEQSCNSAAYQTMTVRVQLFCNQVGETCAALSDLYTVKLEGYASGSLGYVICTANWEEYYSTATPTPTPTAEG